MIPLLIAGGSLISTFTAPQFPDMMNHTLNGTPVKAAEVVCRDRWGTPMMPDGKGSYNIAATPNAVYIQASLIQPPKTDAPVYLPGKPYLPAPAVADSKPAPAN